MRLQCTPIYKKSIGIGGNRGQQKIINSRTRKLHVKIFGLFISNDQEILRTLSEMMHHYCKIF